MGHEECREINEAALLEYAQGRLPEDEAVRIAAHLEDCADCRARAEAVQALASVLSNTVNEEALEAVAGKGDEAVRLLRAKDAGRSRRPQTRRLRAARRRRSSTALWLGLAAAAAAVVLAALVLLDQPEDRAGRTVTAKPEEAPVIPPQQAEGPEAAPGELRTEPPAGPVEKMQEAIPTVPLRPERPELVEVEPSPAQAGQPERTEPVLAETPEGPAPEPAPAEVETARPVARLAAVWGSIRYKRKGGTKWFKAAEGLYLSAGDEIDSRSGRARLAFGDDAAVYLNRDTQVSLGRSRIQLADGEVYCDIRGRGEALEIETQEGIARHLGTKFAVKVSRSGTTVLVEEGRVEVENSEGKVSVDAGYQVSVRKGREPARPRKADVKSALAWLKAVRGKVQLFADDFNRSPLNQWPAGWEKHETDAAARSHFIVEEDGEQQTGRFITCRGQAGGTTQHAFLPVPRWGVEFTVSFRFRLSGAGNKRAGIEFYDEGDHQHPELVYDAGSGRLEARERRPSVRSLASVPLTLRPGTWYLWEVSFSGRRCSVRIDGKTVLECEFQRAGSARKASLVSSGGDSAQYDDVKATGFVGGAGR